MFNVCIIGSKNIALARTLFFTSPSSSPNFNPYSNPSSKPSSKTLDLALALALASRFRGLSSGTSIYVLSVAIVFDSRYHRLG